MRPAARILRGPRVLLVPLVCLFSALFPVSGLVSVPWSGSVPASVGLSISLPVPEQIRMAGWGLAHAQEPPSAPDSDEWLDVEVATVGIDLATGAPLALVHQGWDEVLPIWIGDNEAQAILQVLQGIETPRPMTHDLMASMLRGLGAELVEIRIHDMREGAYIGSLHLRAGGGGDGGSAGSGSAEGDPGAGGDGGSAGSGGAAGGGGAESGGPGAGPADSQELVDVDSRPSDALALALRTGARIRVARRLLEGVPDVDFVSNERNRPIARLRGAIVTHPDRNDQARLGLPADRSGLLVRHVDDGAARQGLEAGDLIVEVGGHEVTDLLGYLSVVRSAPPNSAIALTVLRNGREVEVQLPARRAPGVSG